ncbi:hypothetical protein A9W94_17615 [Mycobacterium asiaticum]|nr:DUF4190 domain-containing protein [Mycobacterium asiaticum]OBJ56874.1 hypothetical protein A9W94_17615 [Mycobacterium asiaticum]
MNTLAITSLVVGILGVFCCVGSIVGVVCGSVALNQIKQTGEGGHGLAVGGIVISVATLLFYFLVLALRVAGRAVRRVIQRRRTRRRGSRHGPRRVGDRLLSGMFVLAGGAAGRCHGDQRSLRSGTQAQLKRAARRVHFGCRDETMAEAGER